MEKLKITVSSTPHVRSGDSIDKIMKNVCIALMPAIIASFYFFGLRAVLVVALSVASCVAFEGLFQKVVRRPVTIEDFSAVVTGLLLAMNLPAAVPFWMPIVGAFFAIIIVKQIFGGLGQNFMNPALAARAFLLTSYPEGMMSKWTIPVRNFFSVDAVSAATPLGVLKESGGAFVPTASQYMDALVGNVAGCLGETCAIALVLGGLYLMVKKIISWRIPVTYLLTVFLGTWIMGRGGLFSGYPVYEILTGGLLLGAFFMATDYSSSPVTPVGQLIMGVGCGLLTTVIRIYGGYPEGVSYSILLMNLAVPLIDRFTKPRVYGVKKGVKTRV